MLHMLTFVQLLEVEVSEIKVLVVFLFSTVSALCVLYHVFVHMHSLHIISCRST